MPSGVYVRYKTGNAWREVDIGPENVADVPVDVLSTLQIKPPDNSDKDFEFTVTATALETAKAEDEQTTTAQVVVRVDGVPDGFQSLYHTPRAQPENTSQSEILVQTGLPAGPSESFRRGG